MFLVLIVLAAAVEPTPKRESVAITTAQSVRRLSPDEAARGLPVKLKATVTLTNRVTNDLFVQDETSGVYISPLRSSIDVAPGDVVEVIGTTHPGTFAPCISAQTIRKVGTSPLPDPEPFSLDPDDSLWLDARYIQSWVYVHDVAMNLPGHIRVEVATVKGFGRIYVEKNKENSQEAELIRGKIVRVRGVCTSPSHDPVTRVAGRVSRIHVQSFKEGFELLADQEIKTVTIEQAVRGFVPGPAAFAYPVRISGIVTVVLQEQDTSVCTVQDPTGAARVELAAAWEVRTGERVTVTGYIARQEVGTVLQHASILDPRPVDEVIQPIGTTADQLVRNDLWYSLCRLTGEVASVSHMNGEYIARCHDGPNRFLVTWNTADPPLDLMAIQPGTLLSITGVPSPVTEGPNLNLAGFRLHMRTTADLKQIAGPRPASWWTPFRVRNLILATAAAAILTGFWILVMRQQIRKQTALIRLQYEKEADLQRSLQEHRRLEAIGRLVGGIAHDFNNLLAVIVTGGELLADALSAKHPHADLVHSIRLAGQRGADLTRQLLTFAREKPVERTVIDLNQVLRETEDLVRRTVGDEIHVTGNYGSDVPPIFADVGLITQILLNLVANARDAMPNGGELTIETTVVVRDRQRCPCLTVIDTGFGMDSETRSKIFEPFFTTKEVGKGTGLGLATVYGIVRDLGGDIAIDSSPESGSTFTITFPPTNQPIMETSTSFPSEDRHTIMARSSLSVLLVDDDSKVRDICAKCLKKYGFTVVDTGDSPEAVRILRAGLDRFDLLITDAHMPGLSGPELIAKARELHPNIRVLVISGCSSEDMPHAELLAADDLVLQKPFTPLHLLEMIDETMNVSASALR